MTWQEARLQFLGYSVTGSCVLTALSTCCLWDGVKASIGLALAYIVQLTRQLQWIE